MPYYANGGVWGFLVYFVLGFSSSLSKSAICSPFLRCTLTLTFLKSVSSRVRFHIREMPRPCSRAFFAKSSHNLLLLLPPAPHTRRRRFPFLILFLLQPPPVPTLNPALPGRQWMANLIWDSSHPGRLPPRGFFRQTKSLLVPAPLPRAARSRKRQAWKEGVAGWEGGWGITVRRLAVGNPGSGMGRVGIVRVALGVQMVEEDVHFVRR